LKYPDVQLRKRAVQIARKVKNEKLIPLLFEACLDLNPDVHSEACDAINFLKNISINRVMAERETQKAYNRDCKLVCVKGQKKI
jgi:HEAT repeat protein